VHEIKLFPYVRVCMMASRTPILDHRQIHTTVERIALEICSKHHAGSDLLIGGISERGSFLAELLFSALQKYHNGKLVLFRIDFDRAGFNGEAIRFNPHQEFNGRHIIVVDDVLNSGKTLMHVLTPMVKEWPATLETMFLAERSFRSYPVRADYVGVSLATTLQEHVHFDCADENNLQLFLV
jgi:pyrimidine operon attenuation protein / uracil phosphoribosyltransferase